MIFVVIAAVPFHFTRHYHLQRMKVEELAVAKQRSAAIEVQLAERIQWFLESNASMEHQHAASPAEILSYLSGIGLDAALIGSLVSQPPQPAGTKNTENVSVQKQVQV